MPPNRNSAGHTDEERRVRQVIVAGVAAAVLCFREGTTVQTAVEMAEAVVKATIDNKRDG